jgi:hypothetical protein
VLTVTILIIRSPDSSGFPYEKSERMRMSCEKSNWLLAKLYRPLVQHRYMFLYWLLKWCLEEGKYNIERSGSALACVSESQNVCNWRHSNYGTADILTGLEVLSIEIIQGSRVTVCLSLSPCIRHARKLASLSSSLIDSLEDKEIMLPNIPLISAVNSVC